MYSHFSRAILFSLCLASSSSPGFTQVACGDCSGSGAVADILDALFAARITVGLLSPTRAQDCACDVNGSGAVDAVDILVIAQVDAGLGAPLACRTICGFPDPQPGDLLMTEILPNPAAVPDRDGEWIEITNVSGRGVDLHGLVVEVGLDRLVLPEPDPIPLQPGATFVLVADADPLANGGVLGDLAWGTALSLNNGGECIRLLHGGRLLQDLAYDSSFPYASGTAMSLDPSVTSRTLAADPASWCPATLPFGAGDLGTPGFANPSCP